MKAHIAKETLLTFPDFSQEFEIHTDAIKLQLGACISQTVSWLPSIQENCNLLKQDIQLQKENYSLLLKHQRNSEISSLVRKSKFTMIMKLNPQKFQLRQILRWQLYIEECSPEIQYIKGTHNVVAVALSRK
jgi:hypothetical protein